MTQCNCVLGPLLPSKASQEYSTQAQTGWIFPRRLRTPRLLRWEVGCSPKQTSLFLLDVQPRHGPRYPSQRDCRPCLGAPRELEPHNHKRSTGLSLPECPLSSRFPLHQVPHNQHWKRRNTHPSPHSRGKSSEICHAPAHAKSQASEYTIKVNWNVQP